MPRVVVQVSDINNIDQALTSCNNLINEIPDAVVEVVFHQSAISAVVRGSNVEDRIRDLMKRGVIVIACRNSMRSRNISEDQLIDGVKIVNAGVAEIVRKQAEGWAYLKL
ncbi:DsrE family protein [Vulcanisaeta sp. JCM 16159]|uniref:DsrE family protein n=1 Tax=Vulcanisaeta sp. JCM 16159 TaxID=1295371 RepID=UPI0006D11668|nr:DsrE family protein [Vulcanisaeta sp. JCM 16159]